MWPLQLERCGRRLTGSCPRPPQLPRRGAEAVLSEKGGSMPLLNRIATATVALASVTAAGLTMTPAASAAPAARPAFLAHFHKIRNIASTVPANGDINPYGVAVVRQSRGRLRRGDVLVSNFNNAKNLQGTGTTIVEISPGGHRSQFARISAGQLPGKCPGGVGLTTEIGRASCRERG